MDKITSESFIIFNQLLASLMDMDLPLCDSLKKVSEEVNNRKLSDVVDKIRKEIEKGNSLSKATEKYSQDLPAYYVAMLKAGDKSGKLGDVLRQAVEYNRELLLLKNALSRIAFYPKVLSIALVFLILIFVFLVFPRISTFIEINYFTIKSLPIFPRIALLIGYTIAHYWPVLLSICIGLLILLYIFRKNIVFWWEKYELKIPIWKEMIVSFSVSNFCRTLGSLLRSKVNISDSFKLAAGVVENRNIRDRLENMSNFVSKGKNISSVLKESLVFSQSTISIIAVSEEKDNLEDTLISVANVHQQKAIQISERLITVIETSVILIFGLLVGLVINMVMSPFIWLSTL